MSAVHAHRRTPNVASTTPSKMFGGRSIPAPSRSALGSWRSLPRGPASPPGNVDGQPPSPRRRRRRRRRRRAGGTAGRAATTTSRPEGAARARSREGAARARWVRRPAARCCRPSRTAAADGGERLLGIPRPRRPPKRCAQLPRRRHAAVRPGRQGRHRGTARRLARAAARARAATRARIRRQRPLALRVAPREAATTAVPSVAVSSWSTREGGCRRRRRRRRRPALYAEAIAISRFSATRAAGAGVGGAVTGRFFGVVERHFDFLAVRSRRRAFRSE